MVGCEFQLSGSGNNHGKIKVKSGDVDFSVGFQTRKLWGGDCGQRGYANDQPGVSAVEPQSV